MGVEAALLTNRRFVPLERVGRSPELDVPPCGLMWTSVTGRGPIRKNPAVRLGFRIGCLAVTYFHMGKPHTIIGAVAFHF